MRSRPKLANHVPPRRQMVGDTATVSTLATVVGQPNTPVEEWDEGLVATRGWRQVGSGSQQWGLSWILLCDPAPRHPFVIPIPDGTPNSGRHRTASSPPRPLVPGGLERTGCLPWGHEGLQAGPLRCHRPTRCLVPSAEELRNPLRMTSGDLKPDGVPHDTAHGPGPGRLLPTSAGNGGFRRGLPCLPSMDSMSAVSSPQM